MRETSPKRRIVVAVTGASGSLYARLLCGRLAASEAVDEIALIVTGNGRRVAAYEDRTDWMDDPRYTLYDDGDLFGAPASGSARYDAMAVVPCSMGMAGRIASGVSDSLASRAADVMLKERRRLVLVTREAPLGTVHLRNMTALSECGAVICPASPSRHDRGAVRYDRRSRGRLARRRSAALRVGTGFAGLGIRRIMLIFALREASAPSVR